MSAYKRFSDWFHCLRYGHRPYHMKNVGHGSNWWCPRCRKSLWKPYRAYEEYDPIEYVPTEKKS